MNHCVHISLYFTVHIKARYLVAAFVFEYERVVSQDNESRLRVQSQVRESYVTVRESYITAYLIRMSPPAPMNHIKNLRAGSAEMLFRNWYTANTNHFHLTDSVRWKLKTQPD